MPFLSIIIPAYNADAFIPRCLDSIFCQDYSDYEVICIDDGSTDNTSNLIAEYIKQHSNLRLLTQINNGMATARNRGIQEAKGKYILFVDSDDCLISGALSILVSQLEGYDIVEFGTRLFNENTNESVDNIVPQIEKPITGWDYFNSHRLEKRIVHFVCVWQRAYRHDFLVKSGLKFVEGLRRAEDDLFTTMVMLKAESFKTIPEILYEYHVRSGSITRSTDPNLDADSRKVQQLLADTFLPMQNIDKHVIYQVLASNYITRLSNRSEKLTATEWHQFRKLCVTPRHRRLYIMLRICSCFLRYKNK